MAFLTYFPLKKIDVEGLNFFSNKTRICSICASLQKSYSLLLPQQKSETTHFSEVESEWTYTRCEEINLFVSASWHRARDGMDGCITGVLLQLRWQFRILKTHVSRDGEAGNPEMKATDHIVISLTDENSLFLYSLEFQTPSWQMQDKHNFELHWKSNLCCTSMPALFRYRKRLHSQERRCFTHNSGPTFPSKKRKEWKIQHSSADNLSLSGSRNNK